MLTYSLISALLASTPVNSDATALTVMNVLAPGHFHLLEGSEGALGTVAAPPEAVTPAPAEAVAIETAPRGSAGWQVGGAFAGFPYLGAAGFALAGLAVNWKADLPGSIVLTTGTVLGSALGAVGGVWLGARAREGSLAAKVAIIVLSCVAGTAVLAGAGALVVASAGTGFIPN